MTNEEIIQQNISDLEKFAAQVKQDLENDPEYIELMKDQSYNKPIEDNTYDNAPSLNETSVVIPTLSLPSFLSPGSQILKPTAISDELLVVETALNIKPPPFLRDFCSGGLSYDTMNSLKFVPESLINLCSYIEQHRVEGTLETILPSNPLWFPGEDTDFELCIESVEWLESIKLNFPSYLWLPNIKMTEVAKRPESCCSLLQLAIFFNLKCISDGRTIPKYPSSLFECINFAYNKAFEYHKFDLRISESDRKLMILDNAKFERKLNKVGVFSSTSIKEEPAKIDKRFKSRKDDSAYQEAHAEWKKAIDYKKKKLLELDNDIEIKSNDWKEAVRNKKSIINDLQLQIDYLNSIMKEEKFKL